MPEAKLISPVTRQTVDKKRVAAYCRVSSNSADQQNSYATQVKVYTTLIQKRKEWELVDIFADEGLSGMKAENRTEFQRMIQMCELHQIDLIVTKSVSRFARNAKESLAYVRKLKLLGIGVQFEKEGIFTLALGDEMLLNTFSAIAQEESKAVSQNQRLSIVKRMEDGGYVDSNAPYGFRLVNKELSIYEPEAEIVRTIFRLYLNGFPTYELARELNTRSIPAKTGKGVWRSSKVAYILGNEKYCGDSVLQKTVTIDCISKTRRKNTGEAPMYYVQNSHPAIISREIFHKTQEELMRRKTRTPQSSKSSITATGKYSRFALTDVLVCGECGSRYKRVTWTVKGQKKIVWRCISRLDYGKKYCKASPTVDEIKLQNAIMRALNQFNGEDRSTYMALMKATISEALGLNGCSDEVDLLQRKIEALNKKMIELVNDSVQNGNDIESHEAEFKEISDTIALLINRIAAIENLASSSGSSNERLEQIQNIITQREQKRFEYDDSIVRQMIECIKVLPEGKLEIIFGGGYVVDENVNA